MIPNELNLERIFRHTHLTENYYLNYIKLSTSLPKILKVKLLEHPIV